MEGIAIKAVLQFAWILPEKEILLVEWAERKACGVRRCGLLDQEPIQETKQKKTKQNEYSQCIHTACHAVYFFIQHVLSGRAPPTVCHSWKHLSASGLSLINPVLVGGPSSYARNFVNSVRSLHSIELSKTLQMEASCSFETLITTTT